MTYGTRFMNNVANYRRAFPSYKMQAKFYWLFSCMTAFLNHTLSFGKVFDSTYIATDWLLAFQRKIYYTSDYAFLH